MLQLSLPPPSSLAPIQNGDLLVPANPGPRGKMAVKTERENLEITVQTVAVLLTADLPFFIARQHA